MTNDITLFQRVGFPEGYMASSPSPDRDLPGRHELDMYFAAHADANTWSSWTEIQDSGTTTLSSKVDTYPAHMVSMLIESVSEIDTIYMLELSYGSSNTIITRWRFAGSTKFQNPVHQLRVRSAEVPVGETIYYRLKNATAVADTALVHFRYFLHT